MSKQLRFYGDSDDLFEVEIDGKGYEEACNCASGRPMTFKVVSGNDALYVTALYSPAHNGCWMVGVSQHDEDAPLPNWPIRYSVADLGYSVVLEIDAPDDVVVTEVRDDD